MEVRLNSDEKHLIYVVLDELMHMPYSELNRHFGSITIQEMQELHHKMEYDGYCRKHGIRLKDMTDEDYEQAYFEQIEREESEKREFQEEYDNYWANEWLGLE